VLKAQKLEEATGKVSPEMFESDYAKSKGRFYSAVKSSKEISRLVLGLIREGGYRWLVELPLTHAKESGFPIGYLEKNSYTKGAAERLVRLSGNFLVAQERKHREKLQEQLESCLARVPNADAVRGMDGEALTKYAIRKFIDYRYNANAQVDGDEITAILSYWKLKETAAWYTDKHRTRLYRGELEALHPQLGALHDTLHGSTNLWTIMTNTLDVATTIGSKLKNPSGQVKMDAEDKQRKALADFLYQWNHETPLPPQSHDTILDCGKGGAPLVLLTRTGTLEVLEGAEGRRRLLSSSSAFTIPPHADHARVAAAELILSTTLENYQREALIAAHAKLVADPSSKNEVIQDLLAKSFTSAQLLGGPPAEDGRRLGLLSLGIIGA
jgi:hypothetical protein